MERCTSADAIEIESKSKPGKMHVVSFRDVVPTCDCVRYIIGRNKSKMSRTPSSKGAPPTPICRHIETLIEQGVCRWRGEPPIIPGMCPECGGRTEPCGDTVAFF